MKGDVHQIWRTQRVQDNVASLRLFLRSSTGPNRGFEPQSLGRVRDPVRIAEGPTHDFGFSILDFGLRTEGTRVSLPEAPARGEWFLVDSRHERIEGLPLLVFVAHVVEGTLKGKRQEMPTSVKPQGVDRLLPTFAICLMPTSVKPQGVEHPLPTYAFCPAL